MHPKIIAAVTILFGAIPATVFFILLPFPLIFGVAGFMEGALRADMVDASFGLLYAIWALLAMWGTYGLWAASLGPTPIAKPTAAALVAGIIAVVPLLTVSGRSPYASEFFDIPLILPVIVAGWHLWRWRAAKN